MIPGFEDQLAGLSKDDEKTINVTFPDDYAAAELAGKAAEFEVSVSRVEVAELPAVDKELAKSFGMEDGDIDKFTESVKSNMQRELQARVRAELKAKVMDVLLKDNPLDVPDAIVRQEAESLKQQASQQASQQAGNQQGNIDRPVEEFMEDAVRRVKLGMIMVELVKQSAIKVDQAAVNEKIELMSRDYEDPSEFVGYYKNNPQLMRGVETLVLEDMVVDWVVGQAKITAVKSSFDELMHPSTAV
jgi:trigger factor